MKLLDVISYAGDNDTFVHRSEIEDFNSHSELVVNQSQEALFYKDGLALDLFTAGRYPLKTANFPIIRKFFESVFNGKNPFPCQVYFINNITTFSVPWGTDGAIPLEDPQYGLLVNVRAYGSYALKIKDSRKFVVKIVGQLSDFNNRSIMKQVNGMILQTVKQNVARAIVNKKIPILEVMTHLDELSADILKVLVDEFDNLGLECQRFFIESINVEDSDLEALKTAKQQYVTTVIGARGQAESRTIQGYTYQTERQYDVLEKAAQNEGAGNVMAPGLGLGMGFGVGKAVGGKMQETAGVMQNNQPQADMIACPNCGASVKKGAKFCSECGEKMPVNKFCPNCGAKVGDNQKFCSECGEKL